MDTVNAVKLLEECELGLREIGAEAYRGGDFDLADQIGEWARTIRSMTANGKASTSDNGGQVAGSGTVETPRRKKGRRAEYPKFFRQGDELVKIGWSKKAKKEYQHRAPRKVVDALAVALRQAGTRGRVFTSEDVLPKLSDPADGVPFPPYQGYLCLAWFRQEGIITQEGRGGYRLKMANRLIESIDPQWKLLSEL